MQVVNAWLKCFHVLVPLLDKTLIKAKILPVALAKGANDETSVQSRVICCAMLGSMAACLTKVLAFNISLYHSLCCTKVTAITFIINCTQFMAKGLQSSFVLCIFCMPHQAICSHCHCAPLQCVLWSNPVYHRDHTRLQRSTRAACICLAKQAPHTGQRVTLQSVAVDKTMSSSNQALLTNCGALLHTRNCCQSL